MSTNENVTYSNLEELKGSNYEIVDGEPDITGWDVKNERGTNLGDVNNLLFDPSTMSVRYLVIDTDGNDEGIEDRKVVVPIGIAQLRRDDKDVILPNVESSQLGALPEYKRGHLTPQQESYIRTIFGDTSDVQTGSNFYEHEHFNEGRFYGDERNKPAESLPVIEENVNVGKKTVETGRTRIMSRVVERPVEQTVNLREEHINVERVPVDRPATAADRNFPEGTIELTEHKEVPVVSKEARVVEEIKLSKDVEERQQTVRDTARNTEVDVEEDVEKRRSGSGFNAGS